MWQTELSEGASLTHVTAEASVVRVVDGVVDCWAEEELFPREGAGARSVGFSWVTMVFLAAGTERIFVVTAGISIGEVIQHGTKTGRVRTTHDVNGNCAFAGDGEVLRWVHLLAGEWIDVGDKLRVANNGTAVRLDGLGPCDYGIGEFVDRLAGELTARRETELRIEDRHHRLLGIVKL